MYSPMKYTPLLPLRIMLPRSSARIGTTLGSVRRLGCVARRGAGGAPGSTTGPPTFESLGVPGMGGGSVGGSVGTGPVIDASAPAPGAALGSRSPPGGSGWVEGPSRPGGVATG
jgi:hypothetical protein